MKDDRNSQFRDAHSDRNTAEQVPDTPQTRAPAYRLAFADDDFLCRDELRPVRLQLELLKPEMILNERGIESTVVLFGGARIPNLRSRIPRGPRRWRNYRGFMTRRAALRRC